MTKDLSSERELAPALICRGFENKIENTSQTWLPEALPSNKVSLVS